jgi:D-ribose pyranase
VAQVFMAEEFLSVNQPATKAAFATALAGIPAIYEPHVIFKKRVPQAIGLIRTGDTTQYANMIVESG